MWKNVQEVEFTVNGTTVKGFEDSQADHSERFCRHLDESGRCGIYEYRPLPCKFELFKFIHFPSKDKAIARVQLPGRGWALTRVDGKKGAKCEILPYSKDATRGHVEDLRLIRGWMHVFKIQHDVTELIQYMETGPHDYDLEIIRPHARRMRGLTE